MMKKDFVVNILSKTISYPLILVLSIYVASLIGAENKGIIAAILVNFVVVNVITSCGFYASVFYHLSEEKNSSKTQDVLNQAMFFAGVHFFVVFLLNLLIFRTFLSFVTINSLVVSVAAGCQAFPLLCFKIIRTQNDFILLNVLNVVNQLLPSLLLSILWYYTNSLYPFLFGLILSGVSILLVTLYTYRISLLRIKLNFVLFRQLFQYGIKGWAGDVSALANVRVDQLALTQIASPSQLGLYSVGTTLAELSWVLVDSFSVVFVNRLFSVQKSSRVSHTIRYGLIFVALSAITSLLIYVIANNVLIPFGYGMEYSGSLSVYNNLITGVIVYSFAKILTKYFVSIRRLDIVSKFQVFGALATSLAVGFVAYKGWDYLLVALASTIGYTLSATYLIGVFVNHTSYRLSDLYIDFRKIWIWKSW